ncbi:DUF3413 domain-containing protein [Motilimonas eburnea]|uniref:DUF3413 domain-containing protein n=1 Tax=Motilimonas eburnea TaxID=1737488 RepID=UPI001E520035|nr:DUF3413 domain-containing protein [Motilimonas eburnea]
MDNVAKIINWGHWFSFVNILFVLIISSRYLLAAEWPSSLLGQAYLIISWLGHFSFLTFAFYLIFIFPISFLVPFERVLRLIAVLASTAGLTLLLLDSQSFNLFRFHLNPLTWQYLFNDDNPQTANLLFVAIPFLFLVQLTTSELVWRKLKPLYLTRIGPKFAILFFVCFLFTHLINIWADATFYRPITMQNANFPLSYPMTAKSFLIKQGWIDEAEVKAHQNDAKLSGRTIKYPLREVTLDPQHQQLNVVMVVVDALRADMLQPDIMPSLSQLAAISTQYHHHFSAGNDAEFGLFGLLYGIPSRYWPDIKSNQLAPVLLTSLHQAGYQIGVFSGTDLGISPLLNSHADPVYVAEQSGLEADHSVIDAWKTWYLNQSQVPKFSLVHLTSVADMQVPTGYQSRFSDTANADDDGNLADAMLNSNQFDDNHPLFRRYKNTVSYTDILLARIVEQVAANQGLDNTLILVTGSHGQEFNDRNTNQWGSHTSYAWPQTQVPMVIYQPLQPSGIVEQDTSHNDIVPTLMEQLNLTDTPSRYFSTGKNLAEPIKRSYVLLGDEREYVVYQPEQIIELNDKGDAHVLDRNYRPVPNVEPDVSVLMQVLNDLRRFYPAQ